jgi:hypothetical protein
MYKLGRIVVKDTRDYDYPIILSTPKRERTYRYWNQNGWWGNQRNTPQCVGYGWSHWLEDGPTTHGGQPPIVKPQVIYTEAQKIDAFPGENYDGTTVRAGAKYLQSIGWISEYRWAYDLETTINTILNLGPVVVGTWWFDDMYEPDKKGFLHVSGIASGGHCYVFNGVNIKQQKIRMKNSWGREWGLDGNAFLTFKDAEKLIRMDGEVCLATEIKK